MALDLTATSWKAPAQNDNDLWPREVIEISCRDIRSATGEPLEHFHTFVRPRLRPRLSPRCSGATGISQMLIDRADEFPAAYARFLAWCETRDANRAIIVAGEALTTLLRQIERDQQGALPSGRWLDAESVFSRATNQEVLADKGREDSFASMLSSVGQKAVGRAGAADDRTANLIHLVKTLTRLTVIS